MRVTLYKQGVDPTSWTQVSENSTDSNGRVSSLLPASASGAEPGVYRLFFDVKRYFDSLGCESEYRGCLRGWCLWQCELLVCIDCNSAKLTITNIHHYLLQAFTLR